MSGDTIREFLKKLVADTWSSSGKATLLSVAGMKLSQAGLWPRPGHKSNLASFIREDIPGEFLIESWPAHPLVHGLFPADTQLDRNDIGKYFVKSSSGVGNSPRYLPRFWAAFSKPLETDCRRYIESNSLVFEDVSEEAGQERDESKDWIEVPRDCIGPPEGHGREKIIVDKIKNWSMRNGFNISAARIDEVSLRTKDFKQKNIVTDSLLGKFLAALNDKDLARIDMPLDVVAKLRRHRA